MCGYPDKRLALVLSLLMGVVGDGGAATKPLYLSTGSSPQELDRIDPVATGDSSTATTAVLRVAGVGTTVLTSFEGPNSFFENGSAQNFGQTFAYASDNGTYDVSQVQLFMHRQGSGGATVAAFLRTSYGTVGAGLIAAGSVAANTIPNGESRANWVTFDLGGSYTLVDGTSYFIVLDTDGGGIYWHHSTNGGYAAGARVDDGGAALPAEDSSFRVIGSDAGHTTETFTQAPVLCSDLELISGETITVTNHVTVTSGSMPAAPAITATLGYGTTTFSTMATAAYSGGVLRWSDTLGAGVTIPANEAISLVVSTAQSGVEFTIDYDSITSPSVVALPVSTVINVSDVSTYTAPYAGGMQTNAGHIGTNLYVRVTVDDPFGSYDITDVDLVIDGPDAVVGDVSVVLDNGDVVSDDGCEKLYEYEWLPGLPTGVYDIQATANEGTEGITAVGTNRVTIFDTPTLVRLTHFGAVLRGGVVVVHWGTALELRTAGFVLERQADDGTFHAVAAGMVPSSPFNTHGAEYEQADPGAGPGEALTYRLVEVELDGTRRYLGPYTVSTGGPGLSLDEWSRREFSATELGDPAISAETADPDGDGHSNVEEYLSGTSPTDAQSVLQLIGLSVDGESVMLRWQSASGRVYSIECSTNTWSTRGSLRGGIIATPPRNEERVAPATVRGAQFRIRLELPE